MEPSVVVRDESAFGIDIEAWYYDISFVFEVEAFDVDGVEEGLDVVRDVGAGFFVKGFDDVFDRRLDFFTFPDGFDHIEDAVVVAGGDVFDGKEEVWARGMEFCNAESDCLGGPNSS